MKANLLNATELAAYLSTRTVRDENGCWLWTYSLTNGGYARIAAPWGGSIGVHRLAYIVFRGNVTDDLEIHHTCGVRRCCNPQHLEALTDYGHRAADRNSMVSRTHCKRGHPLSGDNLLAPLASKPHLRRCRTCQTLRMAAFRARHGQALRDRVAKYTRERRWKSKTPVRRSKYSETGERPIVDG